MPARKRSSWLRRLLVVSLLILWTVEPSNGTPLPNPGHKGVLRWPKNTNINIWVPPDPKAKDFPDRRDALIQGLQSWFTPASNKSQTAVAQQLATLGITATIATAAPPAGTPSISVDWTAPTDTNAGKPGETFHGVTPKTNDITSATIRVDPEKSTEDDDAYKLGAHEVGHALGLDHPGAGADPNDIMNATSSGIGPALIVFNLDELRSVYLASRDDTGADVIATVIPTGDGYLYQYIATWLSDGPLAVFQIDTHGAPVFGIVPASGWMVDNRALPSDVLALPPRDPREVFLAFVHASDDIYFDADHPVLTFEFQSTAPPGPAEGFLNGVFQTIGPTAIPEPAPAWLIALGCAALVAFTKGSRRTNRRRHRAAWRMCTTPAPVRRPLSRIPSN